MSWDVPVGGPFNIGGYALLAHLLAHCLDMETDELVITAGDAHIYLSQLDDVSEQLKRDPYPQAKIIINPNQKDLFAITATDIEITGYESHPAIKYVVAV